jgi:hypothetical protein
MIHEERTCREEPGLEGISGGVKNMGEAHASREWAWMALRACAEQGLRSAMDSLRPGKFPSKSGAVG